MATSDPPAFHLPVFHLPDTARIGWLTLADGARLRTLILPHDRPRARLLLLPGRADFLEKWAEPLARLHALGFAVASFDWRGQGLSTRTAPGAVGHIASFDIWVDDLDTVADWALGELGDGPWLALGHSMGGHLLARWAFDPARSHQPLHQSLRGIILSSPLFGLPWPLATVARVASRLAVGMGRGSAYAWGEGPLDPAHVSAARQRALTSDPALYGDELRWLRANPALATGGPSWGWIDAFCRSQTVLDALPPDRPGIPLLLLLGGADHVVSTRAARRLAARLPAARVVTLPGAAHELLREAPAIRGKALSMIADFALEALA